MNETYMCETVHYNINGNCNSSLTHTPGYDSAA